MKDAFLDRDGVVWELREVMASLIVADEYGGGIADVNVALAWCRAEVEEARLRLGRLIERIEPG